MNIDLSGYVSDENKLEIDCSSLPLDHYGVEIRFGLNDYPLSRHFCYMKTEDEALDSRIRRFHDLTFSLQPPGKMVGPWPGWRGIPEMPRVELVIDDDITSARYNFWGDEYEEKQIRTIAYVDLRTHASTLLLRWQDARLKPLHVRFIPCPAKKVRPLDLEGYNRRDHPRLLFDESSVKRWRQQHKNPKTWLTIKDLWKNRDSPFRLSAQSKILSTKECLAIQDRAVLGAFAALLQQDEATVQRAKQTMRDFINTALSPDFEPMQIDTQAGDCLYLLCLCYDWLYSFFTLEEREKHKAQLFRMARRVRDFLGYERTDYAQAHYLGCSHGLLAFGILFYHDHKQAFEWVAYLRGVFRQVMKMLPNDGFYPHGINLWIYEHTFLLRYAELLHLHTADRFWRHPYWQQASLFRHVSTFAQGKYGLTFGDPQYRTGGDAWMHYLIAARTKSHSAQALAENLADQPVNGIDYRNAPPRRRIWEYLYRDDKIDAKPLTERVYYFKDGQQLFWRTPNMVITSRAGPPLGHRRYRAGEWSGYGHSDPAQGSFMIGYDKKLMINGAGPVYRRDTVLHNTITIDGRGQIGDSLPWAPEYIPETRFAQITGLHRYKYYDSIEMNLKPAYLDFLKITTLKRKLYFVRQCQLVIHDRIVLEKTGEIQWNLHTYANIEQIERFHFKLFDGDRELHLYALLPEKQDYQSGLSDFVPAYPHDGLRDRFMRFCFSGKACEFLFVINLPACSETWSKQSVSE